MMAAAAIDGPGELALRQSGIAIPLALIQGDNLKVVRQFSA